MNDYDFHQLSDKEFEVLCCDLLSLELGQRFERFKPGRDSGVDGRFFSGGSEIVLQCKHWVSTPLASLLSSLARTEAPKLGRLKPARYLLAVSNSLSRTDKMRICEIFAPFIKTQSDILGREDLNDLLARHPEVERKHFKLWLASSNVLSSLLNASIQGRSEFLIQDIVQDSIRYVLTNNHHEALSKLESKHVVIITGEAGIGKTTLARNLLLHYVADGYQLLAIGDGIVEAEAAFRKGEKQIFYFDDFLGSNYLDAISGSAGTQIGLFIKRVRADPNKRFVLTSRTTILNQGKIYIGALSDQNIQKDEFEISLSSLSRLDKAKILYNHIWHSGLADDFKEEINKERRYRTVVGHNNFNPRIISYVTDIQRLDAISAPTYWSHVLGMLNNPADVWSHPFDAQHDDYGRALILLVAINGRMISQSELSEAYHRYIAQPGFSSMRGQRDFLTNLRHLCGSMLIRTISRGTETLSLFNPSIRDFIVSRYRGDTISLKAIFRSLRTDESIFFLRSLRNSDVVSDDFSRDLLQAIAREAGAAGYVDYTPSYVASLYMSLARLIEPSVMAKLPISTAVDFIEREDLPMAFEEVLDFLLLARKLGFDVPRHPDRLFEQGCSRSPTTSELELLATLVPSYQRSAGSNRLLFDSVTEIMQDRVSVEFPPEQVFAGLAWGDDWSDARVQLKELIAERLAAFDLWDEDEAIDNIADVYDFDSEAQGYYTEHDAGGESARSPYPADSIDDIDDLFDRS